MVARPDRVLTLVAFDVADTGGRIHVDGGGDDPRPALRGIVALIEEHRLRVPIWRTFPLAETAAALDASNAGHLNGKIVVVP